jgi:hypothetical protein
MIMKCKKCGGVLRTGYRNGEPDDDLVACDTCEKQWYGDELFGEH